MYTGIHQGGTGLSPYQFNRPDATAINYALIKYQCSATAVIICLAWQAGLLRDEIANLCWDQVDLSASEICLSDRVIPMAQSLQQFLTDLYSSDTSSYGTVLLSDRGNHPMKPPSISRLVRQAMDEVGQSDIRLIYLHHDYIINQLETRDWQEVSRIAGIGATAMNLHFGDYLPNKFSTRASPEGGGINSELLTALLRKEGASPVGLSIALTWEMGLSLADIVSCVMWHNCWALALVNVNQYCSAW